MILTAEKSQPNPIILILRVPYHLRHIIVGFFVTFHHIYANNYTIIRYMDTQTRGKPLHVSAFYSHLQGVKKR